MPYVKYYNINNKQSKVFDINIDFAHNKGMELVVILTGIFLLLIGILRQKKFLLYGLLTIFVYTILSIELLADIDGLTLGVLTMLTLLSLPTVRVDIHDVVACIIIALPCLFWLNTQEYVDGFANSYLFVGLGVAIISYLLFDKQKRQTLSVLVLLTSFIICNLSNINVGVIDIAISFLITIIFTQNYTLSIDLMTIDS